MEQLSGMTIAIYVTGLIFGGVLSLAGALLASAVTHWVRPTWRHGRLIVCCTFTVLFGCVLWTLFRPVVNFRVTSLSPDGQTRLVAEDITRDIDYEERGWRLKARLEETATGRVLGQMVIKHWHSGFDDCPVPKPTPADVKVTWSPDGTSVLIDYGWAYGVLPEGSYSYVDLPAGAHTTSPSSTTYTCAMPGASSLRGISVTFSVFGS